MTVSPINVVYDNKERQYKMTDTVMELQTTVMTGHKPENEFKALKDLFLTNNAFEVILDEDSYTVLPIVITGRNIRYPSERTNLKKLSLSYRYAYDSRAVDRIQ